jgi:hypothetical protein
VTRLDPKLNPKFDPKMDVPPLSQASRQRIRQAVFDRLDRLDRETAAPAAPLAARSRWPVAAALAAVVLLGVGLGAYRLLGGPRPVVEPSPSRLVTGASPSEVTANGARILAGPQSALAITGSGVHLERGEVEIHVAPRRGKPPFVVTAGGVRVEVIGTVFSVTRHGDRVRVVVREGVVSVTSGGEVARVAAGSAWPAEPAAPVDEPAPAAPAVPAPPPASPPPPAPPAAPPPAPPRPARRPAKPARASRAPAAPTARERYEAAARLEQTRPEEALREYRALSAGDGAWAENALFAWARLELELGRRSAARATLRSYLRRYPRGSNAALARALLDGAK